MYISHLLYLVTLSAPFALFTFLLILYTFSNVNVHTTHIASFARSIRFSHHSLKSSQQRKLRHVTIAESGLVNLYQKPQLLIMRLLEMFSCEGDWILDLFSGIGKVLYNVYYGLHN